jgi:hypothetical protein
MRISLKYMIEGMLKIPSREKTNETGGVLADYSVYYMLLLHMIFCSSVFKFWSFTM